MREGVFSGEFSHEDSEGKKNSGLGLESGLDDEHIPLHLRKAPSSDAWNNLFRCWLYPLKFDLKCDMSPLCDAINEFIKKEIKGYLWSSPDTTVIAEVLKRKDGMYCVYLESILGDDIEDEWMIFSVIRKATCNFQESGLVASMQDNDGEFILIHLAESLPIWVNPETSSSRTWIANGKLMFISKPLPQNGHSNLDTLSALAILRNCLEVAEPSPKMAKHFESLISCYPDRAEKSNNFNARVILPLEVYLLFKQHPQSIVTAVNNFMDRDPIEEKEALRKLKFFPISFHPWHDQYVPISSFESISKSCACVSVPCMIRFTRMLYAKLVAGPDFHAPLAFRKAEFIPTHASSLDEDSHAIAAKLGMKLVCGLELAYRADPDGFSSKYPINWKLSTDEKFVQFDELPSNDDISWLYVNENDVDDVLKFWKTDLSNIADDDGTLGEIENMLDATNAFLNDEPDEQDCDMTSADSEKAGLTFDPDKFIRIVRDFDSLSREKDSEFSTLDDEFDSIMDQMESELMGSKNRSTAGSVEELECFKNLMDSVESERGWMGPASALIYGIKSSSQLH